MASRNKGSSSSGGGLRFLWIPGKKKNHHKGRYDTTNKSQTLGHRPVKNQNWTLGGARGQHELIKSDISIPETSNLTLIPAAIPAIGAVAATNIGSDVTNCNMKQTEDINLSTDEAIINDILSESQVISNKKSLDTNKIGGGDDILNKTLEKSLDDSYNNAATLLLTDKNNKRNGSVCTADLADTIEYAENNEKLLPNINSSALDIPDGLTINDCRNHKKIKRKNKNKRKAKNLNEDDHNSEENEKVVKCLYYALQCCECVIS